MKMWSGRLRQPLDPEFERWQRSFPFDQRLLKQEMAASKAHARALENAGVISREELQKLEEGLEQIALQAEVNPAILNDAEAEDVHHFVEKQLAATIGETAYKLHSGRSRNEQIATDLRLYVRQSIDGTTSGLLELITAFLEQAEKAGEQVMPAYTHLQRAEPVLVAHWLLAYVEMFFRDVERLADCRRRVNVSPLGSGAIAGATLALDRRQMAAELGFDAPSANSMDATSDRDFAVEFLQALALMAGHLSRFAEEMTLFATQEFGFVRLPESYSTGSSAMPQKQNPDAMELLRGKAGRICGSAVSLLIVTKGLPLAYNKDLQETQEPVFDSAEQSLAMLKTAAGFVRAVGFDFERMRRAAQGGFMNAMAAATYLTGKGVPFRRAHEQIAGAVRLCLEKGCGLEELSLDQVRQHCPDADEDFYQAIRLEAVIACHAVPGGTASEFVKKALAQARARVEELKGALHAHA